MSTYALDAVFRPRSLALVGASPRERSVGGAILRNLREAGFTGLLGVVNPRYPRIEGVAAVARLADLGFVPELVVVSSPAATVPPLWLTVSGQYALAVAVVLEALAVAAEVVAMASTAPPATCWAPSAGTPSATAVCTRCSTWLPS